MDSKDVFVTLSLYKLQFCGKNALKGYYNILLVTFDYTILFSIPRGRLVLSFVRGGIKALYFNNIKSTRLFFYIFMSGNVTEPDSAEKSHFLSCKTLAVAGNPILKNLSGSSGFDRFVAGYLRNYKFLISLFDYFMALGDAPHDVLDNSGFPSVKLLHVLVIRPRVLSGRRREDVNFIPLKQYPYSFTKTAYQSTECTANHFFILFHAISQRSSGATNWSLLCMDGDIESNPGPSGKLLIGSFNASGCKNYSKLKRLMTWIFKHKKTDRFIFSLQETHLSNNELALVQSLWREAIVLSPSTGKARGVLTLFSSSLFDDLIYTYGSSDGRITVVIGSYNSEIDMFVSLYSPNSGKNAEFYSSFFAKINNLATMHNVNSVYLSGDFNVVLNGAVSSNRTQSFYEAKLASIIDAETESLGIQPLSDITKCTWNRGNKFSTLDYIFGPKSVANGQLEVKTLWALDKSDHAAIMVTIEYDLDKGRGILRPNLAFLDCLDLRTSFEAELFLLLNQTDKSWDPHTRLEFAKMSIRSKVIEYSLKHRKRVDDKHSQIMSEINRIKELKITLALNENHYLSNFVDTDQIDFDLDVLNLELDKVLSEKTKILASKSRIKWLEFGERSNKYFLNLNKSFNNSSYFKSFIEKDREVFDSQSKVKAAHSFYSSLYDFSANNCPRSFLDSLSFKQISESDSECLIKPITIDELTKVLKSCGDTACGPDGIGYKLLKTCWSFYPKLLLDSWSYGIETGILAPSHRESVICLLKKKGKDHRLIGNLRPITLSNCDIKLISKALTKRCNPILNSLLDPHQTAYIPSRIVHDNLRLIDIANGECAMNKVNGYLVSLDAKKAFDSVDHCFINAVLKKFNFPELFLKLFRVLYNEIHSRVIVNGYFTEPIMIKRSVKQGDALSCVLFIMCMETVIKAIQNDPNIVPIVIKGISFPKVVAYADDIAVLVADTNSIGCCIKTYNSFSKCSGLYLNVEKTEVLSLHSDTSTVSLPGPNGNYDIKCVEKLTICGRTFSSVARHEVESNVESKIHNMTKALASWNKRSLSIYGRNLLLKTFGMSQLIYSMQNSFFDSTSLKSIESISFNFLWKKKADKSKAFERISRIKLKQAHSAGGISAPDIYSMNKALMIKQLIRSTSLSTKHSINYIQTDLLKFNPSLLYQPHRRPTRNLFVDNAISYLAEIGDTIIDEILHCNEDNKLHKEYYEIIASEYIMNIIHRLTKNQIIINQAIFLVKKLGIVYVGQLINEYKFPSSDNFRDITRNIINECSILTILAKRKSLSYGISYRDSFFLVPNSPINEFQFTTKLIRQCLFRKFATAPDKSVIRSFKSINAIRHPKEREIAFFHRHDVLLTNEKLFDMKFVNSPNCSLCEVNQNAYHIFYDCCNAIEASEAINASSHLLEQYPSRKLNIMALVNRLLFLNRNKKLKSEFFIVAINNRIADLDILQIRNFNEKNLNVINKISVSG